jgi:hypothetical protein
LLVGFCSKCPGHFGNAVSLLLQNNYFIPKESSMCFFGATADADGSGEGWLYGEDDKYYYGINTDEIACEAEFAPEYYILRKGQESQNFNKHDYKTWDNKEGSGFIPKKYRSYWCTEE